MSCTSQCTAYNQHLMPYTFDRAHSGSRIRVDALGCESCIVHTACVIVLCIFYLSRLIVHIVFRLSSYTHHVCTCSNLHRALNTLHVRIVCTHPLAPTLVSAFGCMFERAPILSQHTKTPSCFQADLQTTRPKPN